MLPRSRLASWQQSFAIIMKSHAMKYKQTKVTFDKVMPWLAGAGFALGHIAVTSNCTLTTQGRCISCGSCVIALGSIVAWAKLKKRRNDFFVENRDVYK